MCLNLRLAWSLVRSISYNTWVQGCTFHIFIQIFSSKSLRCFPHTQRRTKLDNCGGWVGHTYLYIRVHRPSKQSISKEINSAEHEYMNTRLPRPSLSLLGHCTQAIFLTFSRG